MARHSCFKDLAGKQFGNWTPIYYCPTKDRNAAAGWHCRCKCGTERFVSRSRLLRGTSKSCGCLRSPYGASVIRHGASCNSNTSIRRRSPEYSSWVAMKTRCYNPNIPCYDRYGGRGIIVCDAWLTNFPQFLADMGPSPGPGFSIERVDNNGPYSKENCVWADYTTQANNRHNCIKVTFNGKTQSIPRWAKELGLNAETIRSRLYVGWSVEEALTTPPRPTYDRSHLKRR